MFRCRTAVGMPPRATGIAVAGIVQGSAVMTAINLGIFSRTDVGSALTAALGCEVYVANDIQSAASSLAARWGDDLTAVLSMGTGVGGALIDRGRLVLGSGAAGDFGHMLLSLDGPRCPCGGRGCLESLVSGKVLAERAEQLARSGQSRFLAERLLERGSLHAGDLQEATIAGDAAAGAELRQSASIFAAGVRSVVAAVDPARVVLVGALLSHEAPLGALVQERWTSIRPAWSTTPLVHVKEDEDATLLGAARLAEHAIS
jgi:predicted NBD/HSP70 family sugar kinase